MKIEVCKVYYKNKIPIIKDEEFLDVSGCVSSFCKPIIKSRQRIHDIKGDTAERIDGTFSLRIYNFNNMSHIFDYKNRKLCFKNKINDHVFYILDWDFTNYDLLLHFNTVIKRSKKEHIYYFTSNDMN